MKVTGVICEYNPLHNGHKMQLDKLHGNGAGAVVVVMSGNFVQRGDAAILDKFTRASLALKAGADLIIELPVSYALAPAENFARGGVHLLSSLGVVEELAFGSECGDIHLLTQAAQACELCRTKYASLMEDYLRAGQSYPDVMSSMVAELYNSEVADVLREPNNTLGIAYINAINALHSPLKAKTLLREGAQHNSANPAQDGTASGTYIRRYFMDGGDCHTMVPDFVWNTLCDEMEKGHLGSMRYLERLILYKLRTSDAQSLRCLAEVGQGLENRLLKAKRCDSLESLLSTVKTKRYPMARLRRILLHMLLDIRQSDIDTLPPYGRILAYNEVGKKILKESKAQRTIPFSHSLAELGRTNPTAARCAALESQATDIYQLAKMNIGAGETDYRHKYGSKSGGGTGIK